nr:hypothetical protein [Terriglobales bacterium]
TFTTITISASGKAAGQGTFPQGINTPATVTGFYIDGNSLAHGFLRDDNGNVTRFDVAGAGADSGQGTFPLTNNAAGEITGYIVDSSGAAHGFVLSH